MRSSVLAAVAAAVLSLPATASAADHWWSGDWYLKLGASGAVGPRFEGSDSYIFQAAPMISLGKAGNVVRFSSRNDNPAFALIDSGAFRAGITGKLVMPRDNDDSDDLRGLAPVKLGVELGGFAEVYPTDWLRLRGEVRHGIRSHSGLVADVSADAFADVTETVRVSAGPRMTFASNDAMDAYYEVTPARAARSGLSAYNPDGGIQSAGVGAAVNWQATDKIETSLFGEYKRLMGDAADSSLVRERGKRDQFLIGVSATYRFDFTIP
ncbi:MipA/OmpV family protein [Rhizobium sp. TRM95111]|uniref:MipA/OmpV family protein n=1 Tax=Rhizobium alarense TaxID=2846851 RepID=UPI001F18DD12|nr:MipA/OmpV family protein [Rhizobium alarense]MCF3640654.1 MipA/OmpV family protein [Rhizobium alarense]